MTDRLDLEKCKYLAKVGLPQEIVTGDWYWSTDHHGEWCRFYFNYAPSREYYKIPDLETLVEFAAQFKSPWNIRNVTPPAVKDELPKGFVMLEWSDGFLLGYPTELLYKLIEKLVEVKRGDR